ncbi:acyl-[acyl-carrier-protein]--UDP-N-acetylglucosamine O-acyltransferase [Pseudidiomarina planktonica]|uniref:Acyl-[acyl-carrier-protein]--UDP-N-acetylglucosamine O-acyltransferase n=1 Tax=Pseudidiomarina planktonica TaxID=1323738 RepID=A0A1Y6EPA2_9GAMM|nr:acyl-ACP--UDP-N-acetylglucosamine O-acyltransferase [Pseudidiomarina planktonica]RUO65547.1 acyl-ACP--UDP-N-acetylglucosamine O-acyltransferase [Pseudidiomarina planktonica]SMQ64515.1 acyl-[acyl-carrier-protein]--UDP-N-acetylglucosamine O-acyltransferase [Pseudidiomarina planktonica]
MIHETAIIDASAKLGSNVQVGPWTYIGPDVEIGDNTVISSHVVVKGPTRIGQNNRIFQFASIGEDCQDKKYAGEPTELVIGDNNIFRECVTVHRGTTQDNSLTAIGSNNLFMAYVHVAHDCIVGDNNILANAVTLAGHVVVGDWVILGGFTGVHQFCHIGSHAFTAVNSVIVQDVPPYIMAQGHNATPRTINSEGLKRRGYSKEQIMNLRRAYKTLYRSGLTVAEAVEKLQAQNAEEVQPLIDFVQQSSRGIIRP